MIQETLRIDARDWTQKRGEFSFLKNVKSNEALPNKMEGELKISRTRNGHYYYRIVSEKEIDTSEPSYDIIALDPGVRTFQTGYGTNGVSIEWGWNDMKSVFKTLKYADELRSKFDKEPNRRRRKSQRVAWLKMLRKCRNKIDDLHRRLCAFLCRCYKVILLPEFGSKRMSDKTTRKIGKSSVRSMLTWGHYRFRELLKAKVQTKSGCTLIFCDEHWTSKTCGHCGFIHKNLGKSKTFHCPQCKSCFDRDIGAARNILLRFLVLFIEPLGPLPSGLAHTSLICGDAFRSLSHFCKN